jgi:hypothetical protein
LRISLGGELSFSGKRFAMGMAIPFRIGSDKLRRKLRLSTGKILERFAFDPQNFGQRVVCPIEKHQGSNAESLGAALSGFLVTTPPAPQLGAIKITFIGGRLKLLVHS